MPTLLILDRERISDEDLTRLRRVCSNLYEKDMLGIRIVIVQRDYAGWNPIFRSHTTSDTEHAERIIKTAQIDEWYIRVNTW